MIRKGNPRILLLATGGTIFQKVDEKGVHISDCPYIKNILDNLLTRQADQLGIQIIPKIILNKDSGNMNMRDWQDISQAVFDEYKNYDAFIITHGSDTMGYTTSAIAFALEGLSKLVVFTGSQVPYGQAGSDAVMNLENTLRFIVRGNAVRGVYLVFGSQIAAGVHARKNSEFDYDAFNPSGSKRSVGLLGNEIREDRKIEDYSKHFGADDGIALHNKFEENIVVLSEFPGLKSEHIINMAKGGIKGFIIRSYGSGNPNIAEEGEKYENLRPALKYLQDNKIPAVITSQAPSATASMATYDPSKRAKELGAVSGRDMTIEACVAKLSWLIGRGYGYDDIRRNMAISLRGELEVSN
jgi:L-asparaginase